MNKYLDQAAALLAKAADANERENRGFSNLHKHRLEIAERYAALGAIEAGVVPAALVQELLAALTARHADATR